MNATPDQTTRTTKPTRPTRPTPQPPLRGDTPASPVTTLRLLALNLLLTIVSAAFTAALGYQLVSFLAFWTHPPVYAFLYQGNTTVGTATLQQFLDHRHTVAYLGALAGVTAVQVTMLVAPLRRTRSS